MESTALKTCNERNGTNNISKHKNWKKIIEDKHRKSA
jgi:hypothetical protein